MQTKKRRLLEPRVFMDRLPPFHSLFNPATSIPSQLPAITEERNRRLPCTMFTTNAAVAKSLGKRKAREAGGENDGRRRSRVQNILNNPATNHFSYMALLTADHHHDQEEDVDEYYHHPTSEDTSNQINHMMMCHNENLRQAVVREVEKCEERAAKKLKAVEARAEELERLAELYKGEAERLLIRVRNLERTAAPQSETAEEEEAESSSFEDPDRVGPVRLDCKVCEREMATVMVWPCRHVCVCKRCDGTTRFCPVCGSVKTTSVEISLPLD